MQAELAVDYYELRAQDSLKELLDSTVVAYQETLDLTASQYKAGLSIDEAVAQAEAQLKAAQAQDTNLGILRAQYEHAIAVLIGQPASTFSLRSECFGGESSRNPCWDSVRACSRGGRTLRLRSGPWPRRMRKLAWPRLPIFRRSCSALPADSELRRSRIGLFGPAAFGRWAQVSPRRSLMPACARQPSSSTALHTTKLSRTISKQC